MILSKFCLVIPVSRHSFFSCIINDVIFHQQMPARHIISDKWHPLCHDKGIVINMSIWIMSGIDYTITIHKTDVISENIVYALWFTEHDTSTCIVVAVVELVDGSVPRICIPCLTILVVAGVVCFIVL